MKLRWSLALAGLWALEDFFIQWGAFWGKENYLHPFVYGALRLGLDVSLAVIVTMLLPRIWLGILVILDFIFSATVIAYAIYFHEPVSVFAVYTLKEGARVATFGVQVIPIFIWLLLLFALGMKLFLIKKIKPYSGMGRFALAGGGLMAYLLAFTILCFGSYNLRSVRKWGSSLAYGYGYPLTWFAQALYGPNLHEIAAEVNRMRSIPHEQLNLTEPAWPVGDKIAVIQLESVGWNVINGRVNGFEIAPFLNRLIKSSRIFKVHSYHRSGSADMDFAVLSGGAPDPRTINYTIPGILYSNSLPEFMSAHGFHTVSFHGNGGSFFNRRVNFVRMGFNEIWFKDDLRDKPLKKNLWGIRDEELFRISAEKLQSATDPQFHFLITLDSHAPFNLVRDDGNAIFPGSEDWKENYFNSMRILDAALRKYVKALPAGTLVILYGDHTAGVNYADFRAARDGSAEYVPCIVHVCGNTNWLPAGNSPVTNYSDLRILDVTTFLRRQIELRSERSASLNP